MSSRTVSRTIYEGILRHLTNLEEERTQVIDEFFPYETEEKYSFNTYMDGYISEISRRIKTLNISDHQNDHCPFVIIGSMVEAENIKEKEVDRFRIISPFGTDIDNITECTSYLSPIGKSLLLKTINDVVHVQTPQGSVSYQIKSIRLA